jgi:hypothetical protein
LPHLQPMPPAWRADLAGARPQNTPAPVAQVATTQPTEEPARPSIVLTYLAQDTPAQHPLAVYEQLLTQLTQGVPA